MILRPILRLRALLAWALPERRLFIRSGTHTRFVRLTPRTQLVAWTGGLGLAGWSLLAMAILLADSLGSSNVRDRAVRDQTMYWLRVDALTGERDQSVAEARAAEERFAAVQDRLAAMQGELLATESRGRELELGLEALQATQRRMRIDRDAARAAVTALSGHDPQQDQTTALAGVLGLVTDALAETSAERDRIATEVEGSRRLAGELAAELGRVEAQSGDLLAQVEDALAVSTEPLDAAFRATGLDPDALVAQAWHPSAEAAPGAVRVSTSGATPANDETARANRILGRLDEIEHYRIALDSVPLAMPVRASFRYTSPFGSRWGRQHEGVDMAGPVGTPVYATADGVVTFAGWQNGYGRIVIVRHAFGIETRYPHLSASRVLVGQAVERGDQVGDMGSSGRSTGSHLHYEVRVNGVAVDPMIYIRAGRELL